MEQIEGQEIIYFVSIFFHLHVYIRISLNSPWFDWRNFFKQFLWKKRYFKHGYLRPFFTILFVSGTHFQNISPRTDNDYFIDFVTKFSLLFYLKQLARGDTKVLFCDLLKWSSIYFGQKICIQSIAVSITFGFQDSSLP